MLALQSATGGPAEPLRVWRSIHSQPRPVVYVRRGGFVAQRHDGIRNLLTSLLSKICKNVEVEPHLLPIDNEVFDLRSTVTIHEARLDIKAGSFWSRGETAFFDVRCTCNACELNV